MNEETQIQPNETAESTEPLVSSITPEAEFAELKKFMAEHGYRKLDGNQRARWKVLKAQFEPEAQVEAKPKEEVIPAVTVTAPQAEPDKLIANTHRLMAVHGEIRDADDKGKLTALFNQKDLLSTGTDDQIFQAAFKLISDGDSRAVLRKYFPATPEA